LAKASISFKKLSLLSENELGFVGTTVDIGADVTATWAWAEKMSVKNINRNSMRIIMINGQW